MRQFSHTYKAEEFELDGVLISANVALSIDIAYDSEGAYFRSLTGAYFYDPLKPHWFGAQVADWLFEAMRVWCSQNEDAINERLAGEVEPMPRDAYIHAAE